MAPSPISSGFYEMLKLMDLEFRTHGHGWVVLNYELFKKYELRISLNHEAVTPLPVGFYRILQLPGLHSSAQSPGLSLSSASLQLLTPWAVPS